MTPRAVPIPTGPRQVTRRTSRIVGVVALGLAVSFGLIAGQRVLAAQARGAARGARPAAASPADTYRAAYNGWKWWHVYCYRCHGVNAMNATLAPNLLDPNRKQTRAAFLRIVRRGNEDKGMPEWATLLNAAQMQDLFVYVRARADNVLPPGRPDEVGTPRGKPWTPPAGWSAQ
jgi:mono/diheme cytochrome c family protein